MSEIEKPIREAKNAKGTLSFGPQSDVKSQGILDWLTQLL